MFPTSLSIVSLVLVIFSSYAAIVILVKLAWVLAQAHWGKDARLKVKVSMKTNKFKKYER